MNPPAPVVHLVDDDASFLRAMARLLRAHGFAVRTYDRAADLLDQTGPQARGCVVADLHMPGLSGLELQEALIRHGVTMPVIILTGQTEMNWSSRARQLGAHAFLEKLAPKEQLLDAVKRALELDDAARPPRARTSRTDPPPD